MGNKEGKGEGKGRYALEVTPTFKKKDKILGSSALENLKEDWIKVKHVSSWSQIDPNTSSINRAEFKKLMSNTISDKDLDALFNLYDFNHDGNITWKEYTCVIALIMAGSVKEKIKLIFNCFDDNGDGVLSKEELELAAKKFSCWSDSDLKIFTTKIFQQCDVNNSGAISYKEFQNWVNTHPVEFEEFVGVLNILSLQDEK